MSNDDPERDNRLHLSPSQRLWREVRRVRGLVDLIELRHQAGLATSQDVLDANRAMEFVISRARELGPDEDSERALRGKQGRRL